MSSSDSALLVCSASSWSGAKDRCRWCDGALTGRQLRWCSDECANQYGKQHWWTAASPARYKMDAYTCQRCGINPGAVRDETGECPSDRTGKPLSMQVHHKTPLHTQTHGKGYGDWWREGERIKHAHSGCHHHLDLLETLCTDCHHAEHHPERAAQLSLDSPVVAPSERQETT